MSAERVIVSERVFTGTGDHAHALAIGINGGTITAVVPADQRETLIGPQTEVADYGDALITYGLHDAHEHVLHAALFPSALATQYVGTSEEDEIAHLVEFAKTLPEPKGAGDPGWVLAHGWRSSLWADPTTPSSTRPFPTAPSPSIPATPTPSGSTTAAWPSSVSTRRPSLPRVVPSTAMPKATSRAFCTRPHPWPTSHV